MAAATDIGTVRQENEDHHLLAESLDFQIVCDGMGGHQSGALASKLASETVHDVLARDDLLDVWEVSADIRDGLPQPALELVSAIRLANRRVFLHAASSPDLRGMGTTIVAAVFRDGRIYTAHVGDSRIYRLREGVLTCLTSDHSWINELLEDHEISHSDVEKFSKKNVLTRALGIQPAARIDIRIDALRPGDEYLLCTDGLHNALSDELIQSVLGAEHGTLQDKVDKLVQSARLMDGSDNITGGVISIGEENGKWLSHQSFQMTAPEASERITIKLDKIIKSKYPRPKGAGFSTAKVAINAALAAAVLVLAFVARTFFPDSDRTPENTSALMQPVKSERVTRGVANQQRLEKAGTLLLVQASEKRYVRLLENMEGVRVLDKVNRFSPGRPVHAGSFSWALADSTDRLVYKRQNIQVAPERQMRLARRKPRNDLTAISAGNGRDSIADGRNPTPAAQVHVVGQFNQSGYQESMIYINENKLGALVEYIDTGFYLRPGIYTISLRDLQGRILKVRTNVSIEPGEVVAIEF